MTAEDPPTDGASRVRAEPAPPPDRRTSLRARVALLVAAAVGFAVALASIAAYLTVRHELRSHLDDNLLQRGHSVAQTSLTSQSSDFSLSPTTQALSADLRVALLLSDGQQRVVPSAPVPVLGRPELAVAQGQSSSSIRTISGSGGTYRVAAVQVRDGLALILAQSLTDSNDELHRMALVMIVVGVGGIVVAALAGLGIAREGLRPVDRLTAATEHIARTDDLTPIPVRGTDELARLTRSFNTMLGALSQSRERQRQLVADAGHELRTPLTSLRTNFDLLAQAGAASPDSSARPALSDQDRTELMADVRAQLQELSALVGDLVELARTDQAPGSVESVDLVAVLDHALDRVRRRAPGVAFDVQSQPWQVVGDAASLERAMTNLLDNAAKWSPPEGSVTVTLTDGVLRVADQGPGIADADLPHVFERFYRATDARALPGSGLGLAIVRQAAERHGGSAAAGRTPQGGALLTMSVPGRPG